MLMVVMSCELGDRPVRVVVLSSELENRPVRMNL